MSRSNVHTVEVQFGDCDPAGIVFFPNYLRWMDAATKAFFTQCGVPPWRDLTASRGIIGTPVLEIATRFVTSATYGEGLAIETRIEEWRAKVFVLHHQVRRGEELICEGRETRAFVVRDAGTGRLKAIPVPEDLRASCS